MNPNTVPIMIEITVSSNASELCDNMYMISLNIILRMNATARPKKMPGIENAKLYKVIMVVR